MAGIYVCYSILTLDNLPEAENVTGKFTFSEICV